MENITMDPRLYRMIESSGNNTQTMIDYIKSVRNEISVSYNYERNIIKTLADISKFHSNKKFRLMKKDDIHSYLNSKRKSEVQDPLHGWIATYNLYLIILGRFFKWLYYPDMSPNKRPKPSLIEIQKLKRKEESVYKPTDIWTQDDDALFLKYCPSKRDRCFHAISWDTSCRPHELLKLRIKDIIFKMAGNRRQYAEVLVNGKTGQRNIPLINSIPYLKDWIDDHPQRGNTNAILISGFGKSLGKSLRIESINHTYAKYKDEIFPKLLDNPNVPPEDKEKIIELLKKRWNPYIRRHSSLTDKARILNESLLRQHAGWTPNSMMHQRYVHYFGNESTNSLLEAYGIKPKSEQINKLKPVSCPNCGELNKIDSKFCNKCRMVLSYDAYSEAIQDSEIEKSRLDRMEAKIKRIESKYRK